MIVNIDFSQPMETSVSLGKLGEHNSTTLHITSDLTADAITHYRVAFQTGGKAILSEAYETLPIALPLARQLTMYPRLSMQLVGYDSDGNLVTKSDKFSKFYFEPSVSGAEVEVDGNNHDLASEIVSVKESLTDISATIANKADKGESYTKDEENALLYLKASREWVENQNYARASDIPDVSNLVTKAELATKQDILEAGANITIEGNVISATGGGEGGKEPFYAIYDETTNAEIKEAIIDGRQVFLLYDTGKTAGKYILLNYVGHNKATEPYDVSASVSGYIFKFTGVYAANNVYTTYYAQVSTSKWSSYSSNVVTRDNIVEFDEYADYKATDIFSAYGVIGLVEHEIQKALENIPSGVSIPLGGFAFNPIEGLEINGYEVTE